MNTEKKNKVLLAFDGGIEVAVAGCLLKVQGYDVVAVHVRIWDQDENHMEYPDVQYNCAGIKTETQLRQSCRAMQVPFDVISASDRFSDRVIEKYVHSQIKGWAYRACRDCLNSIILKSLLENLEYFGADAIAAGHYARVTYNKFENHYSVWRSKNEKFDTSWMLYDLKQSELSKLMFPTGDLNSEEMNVLAEKFELTELVRPRTPKKDPCFISGKKETEFIESRVSEKFIEGTKGDIVGPDMKPLRKHDGIYKFFKGKKPSCKVSGKKNKFVTAINPMDSTVRVGPKDELECEGILLNRVNLISIPKIKLREEFQVQIGGGPPTRCMIEAALDKKIVVNFFKPEYGFNEGEEVAIFDNNLLLGGGSIETVLK